MNDRELMQQALDALQSGRPWLTKMSDDDYRATVAALCTRLAQPEQKPKPTSWRTTGWIAPKDHYVTPVLFCPYTGEPRDARDVQSDPQGILIVPPGRVEMLAHRPPAAIPEPLTSDQVSQMVQMSGYDAASPGEIADFINGIRHAEAAHGITGAAPQPGDTK